MGNTNEKYVLIGGGAAALAAAKAIRKRDKTGRITMVTAENHLPYHRPALPGVIQSGSGLGGLLMEAEMWYAEHQVDVMLATRVVSIEAGEKKLVLESVLPVGGFANVSSAGKNAGVEDAAESSAATLPYTKLLLATGSQPFNPVKSLPGAVPVHTLRSYEDAVALGVLSEGRRAVVVGGGILGLEAARALHVRGASVTIVELASRILSIQADAAVSAALTAALDEAGISVITGKSVASATATGVVLSDGAEFTTDFVVASLGVRSDTALALAIGLDLSRGIVVNDFMHTSHADIWAAGDCAEYHQSVLALAGTAMAMGEVAGASMAGDEGAPYVPFVPVTPFQFGPFSMLSVGAVSDSAAETALYQNTETGAYRRLFYSGGHLAGALFTGGGAPQKLKAAVMAGTSVKDSLELLEL